MRGLVADMDIRRKSLCDILGLKEVGGDWEPILALEAKGSWQVQHDPEENYAELLSSPSYEIRKRVMLPCAQLHLYMVRALHGKRIKVFSVADDCIQGCLFLLPHKSSPCASGGIYRSCM